MMNIARPVVAFLLLTTAAVAQERTRSPGYTGEDAVEPCFEWATDFDYVQCERLPIPGQTGMMGQTYTLADGSRRTLTEDPRVAAQSADPLAAAAEDGSSAEPPVVDGLPPSDTSDMRQREDVAASIETATRGRSGSGSEEAAVAPDAPPTSKIVEENFELPPVVPIIPGRAEIMAMATGHLNRIETPFSDPMVRTSAQADALNVEFDQNFIYVSLTQPVTLFIHQRGFPDPAVVVSLVPQRIAPRQVKITIPPAMAEVVKKNQAESKKADAAGTDSGPKPNSAGVRKTGGGGSAATSSVASVINTFAKGRVPKGYSQISLQGYDPASFCKSTLGLKFSFHQGAAIASKEFIVVRGMVTASREVSLDERICARHPETLAVAFSPRTKVGPDHPTDFFVLIRRPNASIKSARKD